MREILFRAKSNYRNVGEWEYGLVAQPHVTEDGIVTSYYFTKLSEDGYSSQRTVSANTIGQYTGLTDKNGKKIFEGDIVKHYNNSDDGFDIGALYWDETFSQWRRTSIGNFHHSSFTYMMSHSCDYEVIGNIHDNPELLKGGAE